MTPPSLQTSVAVLLLAAIANLFASHRIQRTKALARDAGVRPGQQAALVDSRVWPVRLALFAVYGVLLVVGWPRWVANDEWGLFAVAVGLTLASVVYAVLIELRLAAARRAIESAAADESPADRLRRLKEQVAKRWRS
jgi:hypothetical protein